MYDAWEEYDLLCEMCEEIVKKGDISPVELDNLYKAAKTKYYIVATDAMMNADDDYGSSMARGMSRAGYPYSNNSRRSSYANNGGNSSYRRSSRANNSMRNYSGHDKKEMLMQRIAELQDEIDRMED